MRKLLTSLLFIFCASCGGQQYDDSAKEPEPFPSPGPGPSTGQTFGDVQPLLQKFCSECHSDAVFIANEKGFLASKAPVRVANKSMPPSFSKTYSQWKEADRQSIAAFVSSKK